MAVRRFRSREPKPPRVYDPRDATEEQLRAAWDHELQPAPGRPIELVNRLRQQKGLPLLPGPGDPPTA